MFKAAAPPDCQVGTYPPTRTRTPRCNRCLASSRLTASQPPDPHPSSPHFAKAIIVGTHATYQQHHTLRTERPQVARLTTKIQNASHRFSRRYSLHYTQQPGCCGVWHTPRDRAASNWHVALATTTPNPPQGKDNEIVGSCSRFTPPSSVGGTPPQYKSSGPRRLHKRVPCSGRLQLLLRHHKRYGFVVSTSRLRGWTHHLRP